MGAGVAYGDTLEVVSQGLGFDGSAEPGTYSSGAEMNVKKLS
jgi:hypothetical protein